MTNLQKRFEKETGLHSEETVKGDIIYTESYVEWLEELVLELELEKSYTDEENFLKGRELRGRQGIYG